MKVRIEFDDKDDIYQSQKAKRAIMAEDAFNVLHRIKEDAWKFRDNLDGFGELELKSKVKILVDSVIEDCDEIIIAGDYY